MKEDLVTTESKASGQGQRDGEGDEPNERGGRRPASGPGKAQVLAFNLEKEQKKLDTQIEE